MSAYADGPNHTIRTPETYAPVLVAPTAPGLLTTSSSTTSGLMRPLSPGVVGHQPSWYYGWYAGISVLCLVIIGVWIGVLVWMYRSKRGLFASSGRAKPPGYVGDPTNGVQVPLTAAQQAQLKANVADAIAKLNA